MGWRDGNTQRGQGGNYDHAQWRVVSGALRERDSSGEPAPHLRQRRVTPQVTISSQLPRTLLFKVSKPRRTGRCLLQHHPRFRTCVRHFPPSDHQSPSWQSARVGGGRGWLLPVSSVVIKTPLPEFRLATLHPRWAQRPTALAAFK